MLTLRTLFTPLAVICITEALALSQAQHSSSYEDLSPASFIRRHYQECRTAANLASNQLSGNLINFTSTTAPTRTTVADNKIGENSECAREPTAWRWRYPEESKPSSGILVHEESIDSRLANVIYTIESAKILYDDPFKFDSGDAARDTYNELIVAGPRVNDELCGQHLGEMLAQIDELSAWLEARRSRNKRKDWSSAPLDRRHLSLAKVLDAYGRPESGLLVGRSHSFGSYSQCANLQLVLNGTHEPVRTRHCWAKMSASRHLDESLRWRQPKVELQEPLIKAGICIPSTCHTRSFRQHRRLFERLVQGQYKLPRSMYLEETLELKSIYCEPDSDSVLRVPLSGKLLIGLMLVWFAAVAHSTIWARTGSLASCLNVANCWADFVGSNKMSTYSGRVDLNTLNLCKVLACAYVVFGHTSLVHFMFANDQLKVIWQVPNDPFLASVFVGILAVDTFFVITGLLMTQLLLSRLHKLEAASKLPAPSVGLAANLLHFGRMFVSIFSVRYLKLVPVHFLVHCFTKSLWPHLGSGPLWDHGFNRQTPVGACQRESWFTPLTMSASYLPLFQQCLTPTWSISVDLLLCLFVIPLIMVAYRAPRLAALVAFTAGAVTLRQTFEAFARIDLALMWELKEITTHGIGQLFNKYSLLYTLPHYRLPSMLSGCAAGYLLFKYNQHEFKHWPRFLSGPLSLVALVFQLCMIVTLSNVHLLRDFLPRFIFRQVFPWAFVLRALWCASNSIIFLRVASDWQHAKLVCMAKGELLKILAKLNYAILLVHWNLVMFDVRYRESDFYFGKWHLIKTSAGIYLLSLIIGTFVHVTIETPLDRLTRRYIMGEKLAELGCGDKRTAESSTKSLVADDGASEKRPIDLVEKKVQ